eukprot:CAMPEP_0179301070 /NCGR_PEP_ID=MMETSP0797-20121207/47365_1 /TAXON_ID=47934 /ORGANISM="Dinophysis acuminata, Strain DAEP01" /LENGTH=129 /DNA_ID=CAMNT_0021010569 /DNA_START=21 /DNA_END=410 /DNA_ORIENTATION=+
MQAALPARPAARGAPLSASPASAPGGKTPVCVVVQLQIKPDRIDDFLAAMKVDADGSRAEPGCLRFDLLRHPGDAGRFVVYEVYEDAAAKEAHKHTPHFKAWADFKASGGVLSQTGTVFDGIDFMKSKL